MPLAQISEKRLAANRANAQKSTGPRTAKGKAKVAENARRTGVHSAGHRMPPRIEAHFRAIAEARTQHLADPSIHALSFEWHMLQGHLALHDSRERALFNAGLEYGRGNEDAAREWVLRQHGYIQALNRYAGWIQMRLRRVEAAILATSAGLDHLVRLLASCEQAGSEATQPTANFEGTNPSAPEPPSAAPEPTAEFEGTNPLSVSGLPPGGACGTSLPHASSIGSLPLRQAAARGPSAASPPPGPTPKVSVLFVERFAVVPLHSRTG